MKLKKMAVLGLSLLAMAGCQTGSSTVSEKAAFRADIEKHPEKVVNYLENEDAEIRRYALYKIVKAKGDEALPYLLKYMKDNDEMVRLTAVSALASIAPRSKEAFDALATVPQFETNTEVRSIAISASWPFHRETILLRNDPSWDHDVVVAKKFEIPQDKWKISKDETVTGHMNNWFATDFDDSSWDPIKVGHWELITEKYVDYDGVCWYRIKFDMPEKIDFTSVELAFGAVDESAWVWLNGVYLGCHDIGLSGWNEPFAMDCRKEVKWGQENTLVVRVLDTGAGGGIWKPISVEILK